MYTNVGRREEEGAGNVYVQVHERVGGWVQSYSNEDMHTRASKLEVMGENALPVCTSGVCAGCLSKAGTKG